MRHTSWLERLDPDDQRTARRWLVGVLALYYSLALVVVAGAMLTPGPAPQDGVASGTRQAQPGAFSAMAAERPMPGECARRDLRAVTAIEAHGETQDVPSARLALASFTVLRARAVCATGAVEDALAIYDGIRFAPAPSTD